MTCSSPCTISGLVYLVNNRITITPTNNCGSATGCTSWEYGGQLKVITRVYGIIPLYTDVTVYVGAGVLQ